MREPPSFVIDEPPPGRWLGWVIALAGPAVATGLAVWLGPLLQPHVLPPFLLAVAAAAVVGGVWPGLVAVLLSAAAVNYWFFPPLAQFGLASQADLVQQLVFWASLLLVAALCAWSRATRLRAESEAAALMASEEMRGEAARPELRREEPIPPQVPPERTVLVADADPAARQLACHALESAGFRWLSACDGAEALELADRYGFSVQVAVIDVLLPDMSGHALVARLAARHPGLVALYTSAEPSEELVRQDLLRVDEPLLPKPFKGEELLRAIRAVGIAGAPVASGGDLAVSGRSR